MNAAVDEKRSRDTHFVDGNDEANVATSSAMPSRSYLIYIGRPTALDVLSARTTRCAAVDPEPADSARRLYGALSAIGLVAMQPCYAYAHLPSSYPQPLSPGVVPRCLGT